MLHLVVTLIYLSQNYSYYKRGDRSPFNGDEEILNGDREVVNDNEEWPKRR